ncbi:hypothetical protein [Spirosoma flavum]|uniref:Transposase n=1 Tax=Spirosoma flavum TaxID=2048557 RepID=A0ABW6ATR1_9BACT
MTSCIPHKPGRQYHPNNSTNAYQERWKLLLILFLGVGANRKSTEGKIV